MNYVKNQQFNNLGLNQFNIDQMKYLIICGCSMSGLGKGSTISALGTLLRNQNYIVTAIKIDPYLNFDAGTMSPLEHGEVFVLNDGGEVDLDLGNYERSLNAELTKNHNITSGKVFKSILEDERKGNFLGKTIQMVPHVTDRIKLMIESTALAYRDKESNNKAHICLVEIGGTVGDLESGIFYEAIRQFTYDKGPNNCAIIMLSYVPIFGDSNAYDSKTKLTQHGIKELKSLGIFPNFVLCRSSKKLDNLILQKIANYANLPIENVGSCYDVNYSSDVPIILNEQGFDYLILRYFGFGYPGISIDNIKLISSVCDINKSSKTKSINIALCGKYLKNRDTYYSILKALQHSSNIINRKLNIIYIDANLLDTYNENSENNSVEILETIKKLKSADGILIPGGFGVRGCEGKIKVCKIARENKIPFLGICLGMQVAVIEFCRNVLNIKTASSSEFFDINVNNSNAINNTNLIKNNLDINKDEVSNTNLHMNPDCSKTKSNSKFDISSIDEYNITDINKEIDVITTMDDTNYVKLGGTLRLGSKKAVITDKSTLSYKIYGDLEIYERHRHRYEVNNSLVKKLEEKGMLFTGRNEQGDRMDMMELKYNPSDNNAHPFYYGLQSHPEFKSRDVCPSLPFYAFMLHSAKLIDNFQTYFNSKESFKGNKSEFDKQYFLQQLKEIQ